MVLEFNQRKHLLLLLFFLQNTQFPGVELKITLHLSTGRKKRSVWSETCGA